MDAAEAYNAEPPGNKPAQAVLIKIGHEDKAVPRYFFHVIDDTKLHPDREGIDLPGPEAVRDYALKDAKDLIDKRVIAPSEIGRWRIEVVDEAGEAVLTLPLTDVG